MSNMNKKKRRHPQNVSAASRSHAVRAKSTGRPSSGRSSSGRPSSGKMSSGRPSSVKTVTSSSVASPKRNRPGASYGGKRHSSKHITSGNKRRSQSSQSSLRLVQNRSQSLYDDRSYMMREQAERKKPKRPKISPLEMLRLHKSILILLFTIGLIVLLGIGGIQYVRSHYRVKTANVVGNTYYTDEEIQDMVMDGMFAHNSLYLSFKYHNKSITNIPFIEKITVDIKSADTIDIRVYEKALAGCISYLENYMYFDREGIIVEGSSELLEGVPVVKGLKFDSVVLYEALPVEDKSVFAEILDLTQLLSKYDLAADQMYFDSGYNVFLYFDNVEVAMGSKNNIDEKVIQLPYILPSLEGKKGTLHLEDYDENTESVRFEEAS